ncbi:MAG: acyl-CoA thioesterase domain-containing protein [Actinomycetota bacterium]
MTAGAYFELSADGTFCPTHYAQSRWGDDHLNGRAVVALVASVLDAEFGHPEFTPARLTVDLFRAARGAPLTVLTRLVRNGNRVRNAECDIIQGDKQIVRAVLAQYRRAEPPRGAEWQPNATFTPPVGVEDPQELYVASGGIGWTRSIADHQNTGRKRCLHASTTAVRGQRNSPLVNAAIAAEGTSLVTNLGTRGVGFINGDLTLALARVPDDGWIGVQADSHWAAEGISVGTATLFDASGPFGSGMVTAVANPAAQIDFTNDPYPDRIL